MPNWTTNRIEVEGNADDLAAFLLAIQGENGVIDFNSIIPMPSLLRHTGSGSKTIDGVTVKQWYVEQQADYEKQTPEVSRLFTQEEADELSQIGHRDWYTWSIENWGTKWNACDPEIMDQWEGYVEIGFNTAWAAPEPIFEKLHEIFPALTIRCKWRHEDESPFPHQLTFESETAA